MIGLVPGVRRRASIASAVVAGTACRRMAASPGALSCYRVDDTAWANSYDLTEVGRCPLLLLPLRSCLLEVLVTEHGFRIAEDVRRDHVALVFADVGQRPDAVDIAERPEALACAHVLVDLDPAVLMIIQAIVIRRRGLTAATSLASALAVVFTGLQAKARRKPGPGLVAGGPPAPARRPGGLVGVRGSDQLAGVGFAAEAAARPRFCAGCARMVLLRWVIDPARFTDVAETLAFVVSRYADEHGGWPAVADQRLQPGALDQEGVHVTYSLLYSSSKDFDPSSLRT